MATRKPPKSEPQKSLQVISATADDWSRQFVKLFEWQFLDVSRELSQEASVSDLQIATARAIVATFVDSGLELESIFELFGQVALQRKAVEIKWTDKLNQRRFVLIDKEIQGTLTPAESIELAGLTRIMRDEIDVEVNLPMKGAQALHLKLLQMDSRGESD